MTATRSDLAAAGERVRQGRLADALAAFGRHLAANPSSPEAHCNRAGVLRRLARPAEARAALEAARRPRRDWEAVLLALGQLGFAAGRYVAAEAWFQHAVDRAPASAEANCNPGIAQSRQLRPARLAGDDYERRYLALDWPYASVDVEVLADLASKPAASAGPLRVGLLSADLRTHGTGRIVEAIVAALPAHDGALTASTRSFEAALREAWRLRGGDPTMDPAR
jgi:tetratricopeptide (TPR) repeat protein